MRRRTKSIIVLTLVAAVLAGCGERDRGDYDDVLGYIEATRADLSGFVYTEIVDGQHVEVRGGVEDDFRYEARVLVEDDPVYDEIVSDDAIAARVLDPIALEQFYAPQGLGAAEEAEGDDGLSVAAAFATKRWVLDDDGAPDLLAVRDVGSDQGNDPIYDAITVLDYLEHTVLRQNTIVKFRPNDTEYAPQDDPFPTPEKGSGVDRYDVRPPSLPRQRDTQNLNQAVPSTAHFRKLAVYVRDGRIVQILENIDVVGRLDEIERKYDLDLAELTPQEAADLSIEAINAVRRGQGENPIRVRVMSTVFTDDEVDVELPDEDVVIGDLDVLRYRGRTAAPQPGAEPVAPSAPADAEAGDAPSP